MIDQATLQQLVTAILKETAQLTAKWGVNPELAVRFAIAKLLATLSGESVPPIVSGYRSPSKQRCLKQNWDAGHQVNASCSMPVAAPARRSFHTIGQAVDTQGPAGPVFKAVWKAMGGVDGATFNDPNHLHILQPLPAAPALW